MKVRVLRFQQAILHNGPGKGITSKVLIDRDSTGAKNMSLGWIRFSGNTTTEDHIRDTEEIIYVLKGEAVIVVGQSEYRLNPGDSIFIPPGIKHRHENRSEEVLEQLYMFAPSGPEQAVRNLPVL